MRITSLLLAVPLAACAGRQAPPNAPAPACETVRDPDAQREVVRLRMALFERSAQLAESQQRLEEATTEVVRAMARSRSLATRAEAASAIAEAEITLQQLRGSGQEARQAEEALRSASTAFDAENYGGAVYLATQAKRAASAGGGLLAQGTGVAGTSEVAFTVPVPLTTTARANLRAAPGGGADVVATVPAGTPLTGYAYAQDWIRVTLADGRGAWVHQALVRGREAGGP